jgi:hypothetical protein
VASHASLGCRSGQDGPVRVTLGNGFRRYRSAAGRIDKIRGARSPLDSARSGDLTCLSCHKLNRFKLCRRRVLRSRRRGNKPPETQLGLRDDGFRTGLAICTSAKALKPLCLLPFLALISA